MQIAFKRQLRCLAYYRMSTFETVYYLLELEILAINWWLRDVFVQLYRNSRHWNNFSSLLTSSCLQMKQYPYYIFANSLTHLPYFLSTLPWCEKSYWLAGQMNCSAQNKNWTILILLLAVHCKQWWNSSYIVALIPLWNQMQFYT